MSTAWGPDPSQQPPQQPPQQWQQDWQQFPPPHPQGYHHGPPVSSEDQTWALLAHLSIFVLGLIGPLVIYLVKKDESPFVRHHAAEALNFHLTLLLAAIVSVVLILVLVGVLLLLVLGIGGAVLGVLAAVAASRGQAYRYPLTLRLVS